MERIGKSGTKGVLNSPSFGIPLSFKKVIKTPFTPYEYYKKDSFKGENNYIFTQNIDRTSLRKILTNVKEGSNAFFIQENRYSSLDTLEIEREIASKYYYIEEVYLQLATESFDEII